jgi:hypothetical protein
MVARRGFPYCRQEQRYVENTTEVVIKKQTGSNLLLEQQKAR